MMFMPAGLTRFLLTLFILFLLGTGIFDYLQNFDVNECSMTYMFQNPDLIPVTLPNHLDAKFPNYKLFLYCEGADCAHNEQLHFTKPGNIPVLFVTGNADSHKQVRSMASVAADKSRHSPYKNVKFLYFTISFNEELSALYGPLLTRQTEFTKHCVEHILTLFRDTKPTTKRPKSVLIIGNSMGGLVSRGLLVPSNKDDTFHKKNYVHTIITQSSPHNRPVTSIDKPLADFYERINAFWLNKSEISLNNVVLASLYGGTRDILVRSGLANVEAWRSQSPAAVVSSFTGSMPYVWRAVDHRCMSWCRELVIAENRALFDMVDPNTQQIVEDRQERERILRFYFEHDYLSDSTTKEDTDIIYTDITAKKLEIAENTQQLNFQLNDFIFQDKLILFNLKQHMDTNTHDSLFIYTNFNSPQSFVLCKDFRTVATNEYRCTDAKDLFEDYGRSVPPLLEGRRSSTIKLLNIPDLTSLVDDQDFVYLIVKVPVLKKKPDVHQLFVKFDWYLLEKRVSDLELPSFKTNLQPVDVNVEEDGVVFRRFYLPTFNDVLQAYQVNKIDNVCDDYLKSQSLKQKQTEQKPLSISTVMVEFHEPHATVLNSQAIQTKTKNLTLLLTANNQNSQQDSKPYIDIINFDISHLLHHTSLSPAAVSRLKQAEHCRPQLTIQISYTSILGQLVRFYLPLVPAFIVFIIQFYDFLVLRTSLPDSAFRSRFVLNTPQALFSSHFSHSFVLNAVVYIVQSQSFTDLVEFFDPARQFLPLTDFEQLRLEATYHPWLGFILYWCAFSLISLASYFLSLILNVLSLLVQRGAFKFFSILRSSLLQRFISFCHLIATIFIGFITSALAHCGLFYGEVIRLAAQNPVYSAEAAGGHAHFCIEQTRLLMTYFLLVLNVPSVIVWTKSLKTNEFRPLYSMMNDCGIQVAVISIILHQLKHFKDTFKIRVLDVSSEVLAACVLLNSFLTVAYSAVSLWRVQYFILFHMFLMTFSSVGRERPDTVRSNSDGDSGDQHKNKKSKDD